MTNIDRAQSQSGTSLAANVRAFSEKLSGVIAENDNFVWSPLSVYLCTAMAYEGSRGGTRAELAGLLGCEPGESLAGPITEAVADLEQLAGAVFNGKPGLWEGYRSALGATKHSRGYDIPAELHIANGLWRANVFDIEPQYLAALASAYKSDVESCDFAGSPSSAARAINQWSSRNTNGKIKNVVDAEQFDAATMLVLANAVYFKGAWTADNFELTPLSFTGFGGETRAESFIQPMRAFQDNNGAFVAEVKYRSAPISFVALAPKAGSRGEFAAARTGFVDTAARLTRAPEASGRDTLSIPKFTFQSHFSLNELFNALGVRSLFQPILADLSGISTSVPLFVSRFSHMAKVEVNEYGTEAAAVSDMEIIATGFEPVRSVHLSLDRPFHFAIVETASGLPLFVGSVTKPSV